MSESIEPQRSEADPMTIDPSNLGSVDPLSVEGIFLVALGKQGDERAAFLSQNCPDAEQRQRVKALLTAYENAGSFLERPAVTAEPTPVGQYLAPCELPGTLGRLGQYEILEEIGRGGMGVVFRAHDPKLQRIVAVKALAPELARLPVARQRFLREARAAAAISHPHVVTIFAVDGTEEATLGTERTTLPYLVMECIVGQTLHDKIKRVGALKTEEIIRISRQIAEGLGAAHKRGLIHRDIKPANILLENGVERVKITDFGLARTTSDGGITHTGEILGTPQCMSPEQARGELVDQRSDLFSLGCVIYTMCTGVSPFRADNILAVMKKVCETEPRPVAQLNPNVPQWLCGLVHQLLQKAPERRVQTAGEVVEMLESRVVAPQPASSASSPIGPGFASVIRGCWRTWIPDVIVSSAACGMVAAAMPNNVWIFPTIVFFVVAWSILLYAKRQGRGNWPWVTWPLGLASLVSLYLGMMLTVWVRMETHSRSGMFVFGLAVGIFWLLTRWFPRLFIQTRTSQPVSSAPPVAESASGQSFERAAARPHSPWSVLGWMLVGLMLLVGVGGGLAVIAYIMPAYQRARTPVSKIPGLTTVSTPELGDRLQAALALANDTSRHNVLVRLAEEAANAGNGDLVLRVLAHVDAGTARSNTCAICSEALLKRGMISAATAVAHQIEGDTARSNMLARIAATPTPMPAAPSPASPAPPPFESETHPAPAESTPLFGENLDSRSGSQSPSIPLADAVEVLTDPKTMPSVYSALEGNYGPKPQVLLWIDEPGLQISLKPLNFEGRETEGVVYVSRNAWGVGGFYDSKEGTLAHVLPGRYRVLVQDLDYGSELDRRGTLVIGNGRHMIHVKRSFSRQQLTPREYPVPFRWAGKSYQLNTADEVSEINRHLAKLAGETSTPIHGAGGAAALTGMISEQMLRHNPSRVKIDIQSPEMFVIFEHPHGSIRWNCSVPEGCRVPESGTTITVSGVGFEWTGTQNSVPFNPMNSLSEPLVVQQTRKLIKESASRDFKEWKPGHVGFFWIGLNEAQNIPKASAPVVRRLVTAWADSQPDVPEAELLQLGGATSMQELWKLPLPAGAVVLIAPETKEQESKPEFVPPAFLVPGSTPGTWRLKEPPEGAVADAVPSEASPEFSHFGGQFAPAPVGSDLLRDTPFRGGLRIEKVYAGTPAAEGGLLAGDILVGLGAWEVAKLEDLQYALGLSLEGEVSFHILRDGQVRKGYVLLDGSKRPASDVELSPEQLVKFAYEYQRGHSTPASQSDPQAALLAQLQGDWDVDLSDADGVDELPPGTRAEFKIEGSLLRLWYIIPPRPELNLEAQRTEAGAMLLTLGAAGPPQQIDLFIGPNDGDLRRETQGIIEFTGDTVKLCYDPQLVKGEIKRPAAFAKGKQATLWTLTRSKASAPVTELEGDWHKVEHLGHPVQTSERQNLTLRGDVWTESYSNGDEVICRLRVDAQEKRLFLKSENRDSEVDYRYALEGSRLLLRLSGQLQFVFERGLDPAIKVAGRPSETMPKDGLDPILAKLQGSWDMHMIEADPNPPGGREEAVIEGDLMTITITFDGKSVTMPVQLKLDGSPELHETLLDGKPVVVRRPEKSRPEGSPQPIDLIHFPNDKQERTVLPGIIEFRDGSVRICLANSSKGERPEVFAVGQDANLWELRRKPTAGAVSAASELEGDWHVVAYYDHEGKPQETLPSNRSFRGDQSSFVGPGHRHDCRIKVDPIKKTLWSYSRDENGSYSRDYYELKGDQLILRNEPGAMGYQVFERGLVRIPSVVPAATEEQKLLWRSAIVEIVTYGDSHVNNGGENVVGRGVVVSPGGLILAHLAGRWDPPLKDRKVMAKFDDGSQIPLTVVEEGEGLIAFQPEKPINANHYFNVSQTVVQQHDEVRIWGPDHSRAGSDSLAPYAESVTVLDRKYPALGVAVWQLSFRQHLILGTPVLDSQGDLLGITITGTQELLLAIPVAQLKALFPKTLGSMPAAVPPPPPAAVPSAAATKPSEEPQAGEPSSE